MTNLKRFMFALFISIIYSFLFIFLSQYKMVVNNVYIYFIVPAIIPLSIIFILEFRNIKDKKIIYYLLCLLKTILYFGAGLVTSYLIIYELINFTCPFYKYCYFESCNYFVKMLCSFGG